MKVLTNRKSKNLYNDYIIFQKKTKQKTKMKKQ